MCRAVLFILRSRLLLSSAVSGVNRVYVVLSAFSVRLLCFSQTKTVCMYGCMYFLAALLVCHLRRRSVFRIGGGAKSGLGEAKSDHVAKNFYVYLLASYTKILLTLAGQNDVSPVLFIIGWAIASAASRINAPVCGCYMRKT